jgi:hypothetical protein
VSQHACVIGERRNAITIAAKQCQARSANRDIMSASEPTRLRDWRTAKCNHDSCEQRQARSVNRDIMSASESTCMRD